MDDTHLNSLANAAGIESRYRDIQGDLHERTPDTARLLLCALGIPANTEVQIRTGLATLADEPWREVLAPATVATQDREIEVPIRLPTEMATKSLQWSVGLEGGGHVSGDGALDAMPIAGQHEVEGVQIALRRLKLPALPLGYHRLKLEAANETAASLIVAPTHCYLPPAFPTRRYWGLAAQLYAVRSSGNWGIGDFADLRALIDWSAACGNDAVGLNPLHALFLDAPQTVSPYSPNSRLFLNPLYLDVPAIPDFAESTEARALAELSAVSNGIQTAASLVDYPAVAAAKLVVLERLYAHFAANRLGDADSRVQAFRKFVEASGSDLRSFAAFQVLSEQLGTHDWMQWPAALRNPASSEVARLARSGEQRLLFFQYLQWQCELQLADAAARARAAGMAIGLYKDLAVSVDAASADHWGHQGLFLRDASVGAPPDPFNEAGQDWGLVPLNPRRQRASAYAYFISLLRANMRHAGALRIDHVMGWQRLFVIPAGTSPSEGAYVRFPLDDLLSIAALESQRNQCLVIGEDLGTVPDGFRERMTRAGVLSCRILYFEQEHGRLRRPAELPPRAAVSAATHDLATLHGYWTAADIIAKARLGIFKTVEEEQQCHDERARDKQILLQALADEDLLPHGLVIAQSDQIAWTVELANAVHLYLARSPCLLLVVQLDDLASQQEQANLPGSMDQYPNWRRRLNRTLEDMMADPALTETLKRIAAERHGGMLNTAE